MRETWVRSLGWEDPLAEGKGYPLQDSGLENSMNCIVHGVAKSWTRLSNFHFTLEKIFKCWQGLETNQEELRLTVPAVYTDTSPSNKSLVKQSPLQLKSHIPSTWQSYSAGTYSRAGLVKRAHQPSKRQGTFPPSLSIRNVK